MKELTKQQFREQFNTEVEISNIKDILKLNEIFHGYKIYRALNLLILEDNGKYYCHK